MTKLMPKLIVFFYFCLFFFSGCQPSTDSIPVVRKVATPARFNVHDLVRLQTTDYLGYIYSCDRLSNNRWQYSVAFQNCRMDYMEEDLFLYRRAEWFIENKQAEFNADHFAKQTEDICQEPQ